MVDKNKLKEYLKIYGKIFYYEYNPITNKVKKFHNIKTIQINENNKYYELNIKYMNKLSISIYELDYKLKKTNKFNYFYYTDDEFKKYNFSTRFNRGFVKLFATKKIRNTFSLLKTYTYSDIRELNSMR